MPKEYEELDQIKYEKLDQMKMKYWIWAEGKGVGDREIHLKDLKRSEINNWRVSSPKNIKTSKLKKNVNKLKKNLINLR